MMALSEAALSEQEASAPPAITVGKVSAMYINSHELLPRSEREQGL